MPTRDPSPGAVATAQMIVGQDDLASSLVLNKDDESSKHDEYLPVFATSRMIALMEAAAARILIPCLKPTELSVGAHVDVAHSAATPPGSKVIAEASYLRKDGNSYVFEVVARDEAGVCGSGTHKRAIVESSRLLTGAEKRKKAIEKARGAKI